MSFIARKTQPVAPSWKVLMIASVVNNVAVAMLVPVFMQNAGYWFWLTGFVLATSALLFVPPQNAMATQPVPGILWIWIGCTLFWAGVMTVNFYAPLPAVQPDKVQTVALTDYVNDHAHLLQPGDAAALDRMLRDFDTRTSDQLGVAIYPRCPSQSIDDFTMRAAEASKLGRKGLDNGAVLFIFLAERRARIEVGYGLEGALPDAIARRILDTELAPHFARGEYAAGITGTLSAMGAAVEKEYGTDHKRDLVKRLWPQFKLAMAKAPRVAWPLARSSPLEARVGLSFFGTLLGIGVWSGLENAGRILWDLVLGIANLVRGRRFRHGMVKFELGSLVDTVKLAVFIACIAGGWVLVAGGGRYGGAGAGVGFVAPQAQELHLVH